MWLVISSKKPEEGSSSSRTAPERILLEQSSRSLAQRNYLVQEPDGTSRFELEDGIGVHSSRSPPDSPITA